MFSILAYGMKHKSMNNGTDGAADSSNDNGALIDAMVNNGDPVSQFSVCEDGDTKDNTCKKL